MAGLSVSGAISGIDTASIINSLVSVEANQQILLRNKQSNEQKAIDAYNALITKLQAVSTAATAVAKTSAWNGTTATSSSSSVKVTATGIEPGSLTFDVTSVAKAHTLISDGTIAGTDAIVASGPITLTINGQDTEIDVGNGSLNSVINAINKGDLGVRATAIQTSPGQYKLQLSSTQTGAASVFTVDGLDGIPGFSTLAAGSDATITIGAGTPSEFSVSSSSNTFTGLVPGLSITVSKVESGVTVSSELDGGAVADSIQKLVDAANDALSSIATQTAWNATKKTGGALIGESAVRSAQQQILALVGANSAPGVELTRDGKLSFDKDKFLTAFKAGPEQVAAQYGAQTTFTPGAGSTASASLVGTTSSTRAGNYAVQVAVTAAREQWRTDPPGGVIAGQTIVIQQGSRTVTYTAGPGETIADAIAAINVQLAGAGVSVLATADADAIVFTATSAGTAPAFTVEVDGAAATQVTAGRDIEGSINGVAATGSGSVLIGATTAGGAAGLSIRVEATDADVAATGGAVGSVTYTAGLAQGFVDLINDLTSSTTGTLTKAKDGLGKIVDDLQKQIDAWDDRLVARRLALTKQFTAMEMALAKLKSQSSFLTSFGQQQAAQSSSSDS